MVHRAAGIRRSNVLLLQALDTRSKAAQKAALDELEDGEEPVVSGKRNNGKERESDSEQDEESDDSDDMEVDQDAADIEVEEEVEVEVNIKKRQTERIIPPDEVRAHLRRLFKNEAAIVALLYAPHGPHATALLSATTGAAYSPFNPHVASSSTTPRASADIFFMDVITVPPTRFRPAATLGDQVFENPQNSLLNGILRQTFIVRDLNNSLAAANAVVDHKAAAEAAALLVAAGRQPMDKIRIYTLLLESLINLQVAVNSMIDSTKNPVVLRDGKLPPMGVKQMLEKKDGLFRKNMMVS